jgi:sugar-specific transcriptional regulator TrmB
MLEEKTIESLVKLGLTVSQAKVYLTLAIAGPCTGKDSANSTHIATNDVYRILNELLDKGLVEKVIAKPTRYKATKINDGLSLLLEGKKEEYIEAEMQVKALNSLIELRKVDTHQDESQFVITSEIKNLMKMHERFSQASKLSIDFVLPLKTTKSLHDYPQYVKCAIKRNVKIRAIVIENDSNKEPKATKNPLFEVRTLKDIKQSFGMHIFDNQEVTMSISEKPMPSLWTNNAHIVRIARVYFEDMWNSAR